MKPKRKACVHSQVLATQEATWCMLCGAIRLWLPNKSGGYRFERWRRPRRANG